MDTANSLSSTQIVLDGMNNNERMVEITNRLEEGLKNIFQSDQYKEYLDTLSRFHNYSLNNTILILMQKPDATLVAGFNKWKNEFKRSVKKGEKAIKVIAPSPYKVKRQVEKLDPETKTVIVDSEGKPLIEEVETNLTSFRVVNVFDVSQTDGKELPSIEVKELTTNVEHFEAFFNALLKISPVPIRFEEIVGKANGYYHQNDKRIAIDNTLGELQTLKTMVHEIVHAGVHDFDLFDEQEDISPTSRRTKEVEAESVAYTVCQHYGLDTSDYSFGYIASWSSGKEMNELKESLKMIREKSAELINEIDENLKEVVHEQLFLNDRQENIIHLASDSTQHSPDLTTEPSNSSEENISNTLKGIVQKTAVEHGIDLSLEPETSSDAFDNKDAEEDINDVLNHIVQNTATEHGIYLSLESETTSDTFDNKEAEEDINDVLNHIVQKTAAEHGIDLSLEPETTSDAFDNKEAGEDINDVLNHIVQKTAADHGIDLSLEPETTSDDSKSDHKANKEKSTYKPVSDKTFYTRNQYEAAIGVNIIDYVQAKGYELNKVGDKYRVKGWNGLNIDSDGSKWYDFSSDQGGGVVHFARWLHEVEGRQISGKEAIIELAEFAGGGISYTQNVVTPQNNRKPEPKTSPQKEPFIQPEKNDTMKHIFAYLIKTRHINPEVVKHFVENKTLYEDTYRNCVFLAKDQHGSSMGASLRSSQDYKKFTGMAKGSDSSYSFGITGSNDVLRVFESPIDMMSFVSLKMLKDPSYLKTTKDHFQAMGGLRNNTLDRYLKEHPDIKSIVFSTDRDQVNDLGKQPGLDYIKKSYERLMKEMPDRFSEKEQFKMCLPDEEYGKDWNDHLKSVSQLLQPNRRLNQKFEHSKGNMEQGMEIS